MKNLSYIYKRESRGTDNMKRREFLHTAGMMAAAGMVGTVAPAACCGRGDSPVSASRCDKKVKNSFECDVLVIGGGPAGVCAAVSAAREGAEVIIVESSGCLGGMGTNGLVAPFMTCFDKDGEQQVILGIFEEIVQKMIALGGAIHPSKVRHTSPYTAWITAGHDHCTPFEPEALKFVLDNMTRDAGVKLLLHTSFVEPIMKGNAVAGAVVLTKSGLDSIRAKVTVDCTGDGDVAYRAGVPCVFGNGNGKVQPSTMFFHINNVDSARLEADVRAHLHEFRRVNGVSYRALHWRVAEAEAAGEWDIARKSVNIYKCVKDDEWAVNSTRISGVDATDSESLTEAETEGRRQVWQLMHFFRKYVPGCENATLMGSGATIGIRESRHIVGEHTLTADELIRGDVPDDSILLASNSVDVHGGGGAAAGAAGAQGVSSAATTYTVINAPWYGVPYRSLLPQGVQGLLVAGRCLSATSDAAGAVRVMPPVMAMGQAAGTAAAMCVKLGCQPSSLDTQDLRNVLVNNNVFLG